MSGRCAPRRAASRLPATRSAGWSAPPRSETIRRRSTICLPGSSTKPTTFCGGAAPPAAICICRFAELNVAYAPGFALYGSILGRMIAANPPNALAHAGTAERVTRLALELEPGNQMARLTLGLALLNTPPAFGGDPERAEEEIRTAFAGEGLALRSLAGVWLAVAYVRLGRIDEATDVIEQVLDLAPGFRPARATAEALAQGVEPLEHWQQTRARPLTALRGMTESA